MAEVYPFVATINPSVGRRRRRPARRRGLWTGVFRTLVQADPTDCDGLVLPGGVRKPDDLPAFCAKIVEEFAEGAHRVAPAGLTAADGS